MKVKNIVFSGFMGAILMTAADAATIASKNYVDSFVGAREAVLQNQISANVTAINNHADLIDANSDAITANANSITAMDAAYKQADADTLSAANAYTDEEITKLNNSLTQTGGNVGALTNSLNALTERVATNETNISTNTGNISTNTGNISTNTAAIEALGQTVEANKAAAEKAVKDLADGAVATNTGAIATLNGDGDGSVAKAIADAIGASESAAANKYAEKTYVDNQDDALDARIVANENYIAQHKTDYQTLNSSVSTNTANIATNTGNITTLMANAETTGSVDNKVATSAADTKTAYEAYAIPKPSESDCNAASGLCVLSVSADGQTLQWVDVTDTVANGTDTPGQES